MAAFQLVEGPPHIMRCQEGGSTQTFEAGDPVIMSSGQVIIATSGADVWGIAAQDATGTQATIIEVHRLLPDQVWSISADSAATPAVTSHVGVNYTLTISAGATVLNITGATSAGFMVLDLDPRDTAAAGSRVLVAAEQDTCDSMGG